MNLPYLELDSSRESWNSLVRDSIVLAGLGNAIDWFTALGGGGCQHI